MIAELGRHTGAPLEDRTQAAAPTAAMLSTRPLTAGHEFFRIVARWGQEVAEALFHAHDQGVIHRDVKPANLLLDGRGHLWVTDFGLAQLQGDARLTLTSDLVGTLRYMSPEQALGKRWLVDHRTDIYSLGVTFYELLTLRPAFEGHDRQELLRRITSEEPVPPRRLNRAIPADLETIVLKAMAKSPEERYATAKELADDLRRFQEHHPILARRPTVWQRVKKWARRHRSVVTTAAVAAVVMLGGMVVVLAASHGRIQKALDDRTEALEGVQTAKRDVEGSLKKEQRASYLHRILLAHLEWQDGAVDLARQRLDECPPEVRRWEFHYLRRLCHADLRSVRIPSTGPDRLAALDPEGKLLAGFGAGDQITVWDARTGQEVCRCGSYGSVRVVFSRDGKRLGVNNLFGPVRVLDAQTGHLLATVPRVPTAPLSALSDMVHGVTFSPDGRQVAFADRDGTVQVRDLPSGRRVHALPHAGVCALAYRPDGARLASAGGLLRQPGEVKLWDTSTGRLVGALPGHRDAIRCLAFSPEGERLAAASSDGTAKVWELTGDRPVVLTLPMPVTAFPSLAFSPDGRYLAGSADRMVRVWELPSGREVLTLRGHTGAVSCLAYSRDGKEITSYGADKVVKVWDARASRSPLTFRGHSDPPSTVLQVAFGPDGVLVTAGMDRTVRVWDVTAKQPPSLRQTYRSGGHKVVLGPDGTQFASASADRVVTVCDTATGEARLTLRLPFPAQAIALSPDGRRLAVGGPEAKQAVLAIWDVATGRQVLTRNVQAIRVWSLAFSPDGQRLAASIQRRGRQKESPRGVLGLWNARTGEEVFTVADSVVRHPSLAFSPGGQLLASAGVNRPEMPGEVKLWDATTGKELAQLRGHTRAVNGVVFSPDNQRLVSVGNDGALRVWDVATGQGLLTLQGHAGRIACVTFSPDGHRLASADQNGFVQIWDGTPWKE